MFNLIIYIIVSNLLFTPAYLKCQSLEDVRTIFLFSLFIAAVLYIYVIIFQLSDKEIAKALGQGQGYRLLFD